MDPHLLIVDDDERIRSLLQQFLIQSDYLVSTAEETEQARKPETTRADEPKPQTSWVPVGGNLPPYRQQLTHSPPS